MPYEIEHHYATLNGYRMHYASCGSPDRPLLLCLHGFPESWHCWEGVLQTLAERFHVVAPDTRGINESEGPGELQGYRVRNMVSDVAALLDHLGQQQCILAGHDWGGAIACAFAIAHPERLRGLVIVNSTHSAIFARELRRSAAQREASAYIQFFLQDDTEASVCADDHAYLRAMLAQNSQTGAPPAWFDETLQEAYRRAWSRPGSVRAGLSYYRASQYLKPSDGAAAIPGEAGLVVRVPTLFVWGERDGFLLTGCIDGLDQYFTNVQVERIPEGSHWVIHEHGESVSRHIAHFAARLGTPEQTHVPAD